MSQNAAESDAAYFLGFDGGGTKTECVLADGTGRVLARATSGRPILSASDMRRRGFRLGKPRTWSWPARRLRPIDIRGICAGIGGAGREGVAWRLKTFFERSYRNAEIRVTTDLEIALEAAFGEGEGIMLLAGTGSAVLAAMQMALRARAGGRGPWFSDEGSAFDIGRRAFSAIVLAQEHRGPATALFGTDSPVAQAS